MAKNELKAQVKAELLKSFPEDVVKKGLARGERWIKMAYSETGAAGYDYHLRESGSKEGLITHFRIYCEEVVKTQKPGISTMNRETFGIYNPNRRR